MSLLDLRAGEANLKPQPHEDYGRLSLDLTTARTDTEILIHGDFLAKIKYDGSSTGCYFKLDHRHAALIYAKEFKQLKRRYARIFLTNTAQPGKTLILQINELSVSVIEPDIKTLDSDSLDDIETAVEAIQAYHVADGGGELQAIKDSLVTIDGVLDSILLDTALMDGWDDGAQHLENKEYYDGNVFVASKTCAASAARVYDSNKKLSELVIRNTHATLDALIGDQTTQSFPLKHGESTSLRNVNAYNVWFIDGTGHATLEFMGSEQ